MINSFEVRGNLVAIFLDRRDGSVIEAIIDKDDLGIVSEFNGKWYAFAIKKRKLGRYVSTGNFYVSGNSEGKLVALHRLLMGYPDTLVVDHINHNPLDNTRKNLRVVSTAVNAQNTRMRSSNTSGYRGVGKSGSGWCASVKVNGKHTPLGWFKDVHEAGRVALAARARLIPGYIEKYYEFPKY